jgi:sugar lactone lactonase YvrE
LRELEAQFPNELAVVGVHSGKFTEERDTASIRDAALRLDAIHPTVNDRQFRVWRAYAVRAWPTLVAIDPRGYVVGMHAGEFLASALTPFIQGVLAEARSADALDTRALHFAPDPPTTPPDALAFPGKVAVAGNRIAIADSGHHRVVVGTLDESGLHMQIDHVFGGNTAGYRDGSDPLFENPQGLAFSDDTLYVADAGNHCIRAIALDTGVVRTIAGTGQQARTSHDFAVGAMSSPWDIAVGDDTLYVAMAGTHQVWTVDLTTHRASVHSGSGAEELHDGTHAQAALAQPMGLCLSDDDIFVADSESSAIRAVARSRAGSVRTIVGTGLFDFGNVDGMGDDVRLQHAQSIARAHNGRLLVADSYNGALKWIDPHTRRTETWVGGFREPSGIVLTSTHAYVADTNLHRIAVVDLATAEVQPLLS